MRLLRAFLFVVCLPVVVRSAEPTADNVLAKTNMSRGLAVVVGDRLGLAKGLAEKGTFLVHLLVDDDKVMSVREAVAASGFGGRVIVGAKPGAGRLPEPDRFVNLVVVDIGSVGAPSLAEVQRVLAVRGVGYVRREGAWGVLAKEQSARIDGWFAHWYDASGNCVSDDRVAAFPKAIQWQHGPMFEDGTADGKIPRIADGKAVFFDNHSGDLVCRDSGNGLLLWRRFVGSRQNSDVAIAGGRIHLWYDPDRERADRGKGEERGRLTAFDLDSGEPVRIYDEGVVAGTAASVESPWRGRTRKVKPVPWFVVTDAVVVQAYGPRLVVLDRKSGKRLWSRSLERATWFSPVVSSKHVIVAEAVVPATRGRNNGSDHVRAVSAFDAASGKRIWRNEDVHPLRQVKEKETARNARASFKNMSVSKGRVLLHVSSYQFREGGSITLLDESTGKRLWRREFEAKQLYTQGSQRPVIRGDEVVVLDGTGVYRYSLATGEPVGEPVGKPKQKRSGRSNGACTASRATTNWLLANGWLYVDSEGQRHVTRAARGACGQGVVPAHGLLFVPPTPCDCGDYLRGYLALGPSVPGRKIDESARWIRGVGAPRVKGEYEWPSYLGGGRRTSHTSRTWKGKLESKWQAKLARVRRDAVTTDRQQSERYLGALSGGVVGAGVVVVSALEEHRIIGVDVETGRPRWSYPTGGKVDSPPTLARGLAVFGCDDGSVTALRLDDGKLVWRYRVEPTDGVALHHGHLGSTAPIPGSVLILGGTVIAVAGAHTDLGGLHVVALDLATGKRLAKRILTTDAPPALGNNLTVADDSGTGFWVVSPPGGSYGAGGAYHLSATLEDIPTKEGDAPPTVCFDRQGSRVRFRTDEGRGGSTHGWKGAMRGNGFHRLQGHRVAITPEVGYGLNDPGRRTRAVLWATNARDKRADPLWQKSASDLDKVESLGTLVCAGDRLLVGGGSRDGSSGVLFVVDAKTGRIEQKLDLPARVAECGIAVSGESVFVSCEDGSLVRLTGAAR